MINLKKNLSEFLSSLSDLTDVCKLYVQEVYTILKSMTQAGSFLPYEHFFNMGDTFAFNHSSL